MLATLTRVGVLTVLLAGPLCLRAADPPAVPKTAPPADRKADKQEKDEEKRPTTKEEFAALAKAGPRPPWLPFGPGHNMVRDETIDGTVVAVSRAAIEIRPWGKKETVKYPPHTLLDTGAVCHWETDSHCYLLDDVQKGDEVMLGVGTVDKEKGEECFYVRIRKRPGGVIPPSRKPSERLPYHRDTQAEIDHFEKGTPLPEHLQPKTTSNGRPLPPSLPPPTAPKEGPVAPPATGNPKKKD